MPKQRNKQKNMNNYELLITFIPKIESLTANSVFAQISMMMSSMLTSVN